MEKAALLPVAQSQHCPFAYKSRFVRVLIFTAAMAVAAVILLPQCLFKKERSLGDVCPFKQPDLSTPIFHSTRPRLFKLLKDALPDSNTILLPSAPRILQAESDAEYPNWKQTADVKYLLDQYHIDGGLIVLNPTETAFNISIYLPIQTEREAIFMGALPSKQELIEKFSVQNVFSVADLPNHLAALKGKSSSQIVSTVDTATLFESLPSTVIDKLAEDGVEIEFSFEAQQAFWNARFVKTDEELVRLAYASHLASWVHKEVAKWIYKGKTVTEIELNAEFVRLSALCGGDLQSYYPIVGAGPNGAVLHYRTGNLRQVAHEPIQDGTFVLIDAAPEFAGYTSDLTRTYARHKKWTKEMKEVHGIVERVQSKFIHDYYQLDADWAAINQLTKIDLTQELVKAGFILGSVEDALANNVANSVFMPHGLGHPVGLEVHDPVPTVFIGEEANAAFVQEEKSGAYFAWSKSTHLRLYEAALANFKVFKGHITTVEPGIYFIPKLLEATKQGPLAKFINWEKIEEGNYVQLGGVRIEDVVLFDHSGNKRIITRE